VLSRDGQQGSKKHKAISELIHATPKAKILASNSITMIDPR
jgi:hypothetical protein